MVNLYSLAIIGSKMCEFPRNSERNRSYSRSRSSKVIDLDVNRKRICDFLLVISNNFEPPTVFEILTFKARKWLVFPTLLV